MRGDTRYSSLSAGKCLRRPVKLMLWRLVLYAGMRARDAHRAGTKAPSPRPGPPACAAPGGRSPQAPPRAVRTPHPAPPLYDAAAATGPRTALTVSRPGPVLFSRRVPGCRPLLRQPRARRVPLRQARPRPAAPGGRPASRRPVGLTARRQGPDWSPLFAPARGSLPPPHAVPARVPSCRPLVRQPGTPAVPVLRMYEERGPALPTTFP